MTDTYPRPVLLGAKRTYAVELTPGVYRLMVKRSPITGRFISSYERGSER